MFQEGLRQEIANAVTESWFMFDQHYCTAEFNELNSLILVLWAYCVAMVNHEVATP